MISVLALALSVLVPTAEAARVKEIASVYGVRTNSLIGYGIVVGLNKTGDSSQNLATMKQLQLLLAGLGIPTSADEIKSKNIAAVLVRAEVAPGARPGSRFDLLVSSTGDARSLSGGTLVMTELRGFNGSHLGTAEGPVLVGGYSVSSGGNETIKNHPTVGSVPRGGMLEAAIPVLQIAEQVSFDWVLDRPDFTNSTRMAAAVNAHLNSESAKAIDGATVRVLVPDEYLGRQAELVAALERLEVPLDVILRVGVNERTGTLVMGADIPLSPVAVAHGSLMIEVTRRAQVSQPNPLAMGTTAQVTNTEVTVREEKGAVTLLKGATVGDVVGALNAMGVTPLDLISILQSMRRAGGIHAEIEAS